MKAAREESSADQISFPPGSPWWAPVLIRHGITALIAMWALWILGDQIRTFPAKMEMLADKVAHAIQASAEAQIRASTEAEARATERTRAAVREIITEVQKGK